MEYKIDTRLVPDFRVLCALASIIIAFATPSFAIEEFTIGGRDISVVDGDSIEINGAVYNLAGIDAPELGQICDHGGDLWACGLTAAYALRKQLALASTPINCRIERTADVSTVTCIIVEAEISLLLLHGGYVTARPGASPHYSAAEHSAKHAPLGIWGSKFVLPAEWRRGTRLSVEHEFGVSSRLRGVSPSKFEGVVIRHGSKTQHRTCLVKGVVTENNERLYYGPLDKEYDSIEIDPTKGGRFFCGDDNARQAGWRRKGEKP